MPRKNLSRILLPVVAVLALTALAGCYYGYYGGGVGVEVGAGPPGFRTEVAIAAPGPGYYWVPGYWDWAGAQWGWVPGTWVRPPHAHAVWVAPRYYQRHGRWNYAHGHWR